jgi:ubiquinone/menaquinone biosynthesis C-methylase UbiE
MICKIIKKEVINEEDYKVAYNEVANTYNIWLSKMGKYTDKLINSSFISIDEYNSILDFACGTGYITRNIFNNNIDCNITAVDISESMMRNLKDLSNVNCINIDGIDYLNTTNEQFDIIFCGWALPYFNHKELLKLFKKVLKKNGKVAVISNSQGTLNKIEDIFLKVMEENYKEVIKPMDIRFNLPNGKKGLSSWFENEGYKVLETYDNEVKFSFNSGEELLDWLNKSGAIAGTKNIFRDYNLIKHKLIKHLDILKDSKGKYVVNHKFCCGVFEVN